MYNNGNNKGNQLRAKQWDYVKWGKAADKAPSKKVQLDAVGYDAEFICQMAEGGQDKIKFNDVCRFTIKQKDFFKVGQALCNRAVGDILRKSYKAKDEGQNTVLTDLAYRTDDFHILRILSMMVFKDGQSQKVTKIMIHKLNGWDDVKAASKAAAAARNGSLGYTKESCIFEITFSPYPEIAGNWSESEDILSITELGEKLKNMFLKPTSYGSFLDRVYEASTGDESDNKQSSGNSGSSTSSTGVEETTVSFGDDDFFEF